MKELPVEHTIFDLFRLHGKTVLVIGSNRGLGLAMAQGLAEAGANIVIAARDEVTNHQAEEMLKSRYAIECISTVCDVLDEKSVNATLPGPYATDINLPLLNDPEKYQAFINKIPMGRWGELHEIGGIALFLASRASGYVTGACFSVNGGRVAQ